MKRFDIHPAAIIGALICSALGTGLAVLGFGDIWGLWEEPAREVVERMSVEEGERAAESERTAERFQPFGPTPPYEELFRHPSGGGALAPMYRQLPDRCGSLQPKGEPEERAFAPTKTAYRADIRGDLATVVVEQVFTNPGESTLDAVYQFPLNHRAAVFGMTMQIGDRVHYAKIKEKKEARRIYEEANRQGKNAALLSQKRPNWFTQRVANIGPGQTVRIELHYVHPLPREEGVYQFVVPTKLGRRYGDGGSAANDLVAGDGVSEAVPGQMDGCSATSIDVDIDAPVPVRHIKSPTHRLRLRKYDPDDWRVVPAGSPAATDEHFRLEIELSGTEPRAGLNAYWDEEADKGYFSLLIEPPHRPEERTISNREVVFVLDTSGSMHGRPLETSKAFVRQALKSLRRKRDAFRIVQFDNSASELSTEPVPKTRESVERAMLYLDGLSASGGTEYGPGLAKALGPDRPGGSVRLVVFLTDGRIGYEFEALRKLRAKIGDARLYGIGVGRSVNRYLLEEMGRMGRGFARFPNHRGESKPELNRSDRISRIVDRIESPIMTHLRIDWGGLGVSKVSPAPVPDLFAGESVRIHGTYDNPGEHTITIHGTVGPERVSIPVTRHFPSTDGHGKAVELTWARQQIRENMHAMMGAKIRREEGTAPEVYKNRVIDLGLEHSLVTQWTSFVAVDHGEASVGGRGAGGMGLRGTGRGGGGSGFGRVFGLGKVSTGGAKGSAKAKLSKSTPKLASASVTKKSKRVVKPNFGSSSGAVQGSLSRNVVRNKIRDRRNQINACYKQRLKSKPSLEGKLVVKFDIERSGEVGSVRIIESSIDDARLEACIRTTFEGWSFGEQAGDAITVRYPFIFRSP